MWDEITYLLPNFIGAAVEVCRGMDKLFHPIPYDGFKYLSMLGLLKLNHVSERGPLRSSLISVNWCTYQDDCWWLPSSKSPIHRVEYTMSFSRLLKTLCHMQISFDGLKIVYSQLYFKCIIHTWKYKMNLFYLVHTRALRRRMKVGVNINTDTWSSTSPAHSKLFHSLLAQSLRQAHCLPLVLYKGLWLDLAKCLVFPMPG